MGKLLRVLILEDSEADALLMLRELRHGGYDPAFERVETAEDMGSALLREPWDVIISDYSMPSFSAPAALAILQESGLDLPFIVVSGTIGEQTAVEAMKAGAHDYVMKYDLTRLAPAVTRELRDLEARTERRRADARAAHAVRLYRMLSEANEALLRARDRGRLFEDLCRIAVGEGAFPAAWIGLIDESTGEVTPAARSGLPSEDLGDRRPHIFPLWVGTRAVGVLGVCTKAERPLQQDEDTLLNELAASLSFGLEAMEREERRREAEARLKQSFDRLARAMEGTIRAMAAIAEVRDPYTAGHQRRVSHLATAIAMQMGLSAPTVESVRMAGTIHDIGKIAVPAEILAKPGRISEFEFNLIKTHPGVAHEILKAIEFPWPVADIVAQHHERMDGSGYPAHLRDGDILQEARVLMVADVVEAMASHRPYRPALGIKSALEEISHGSGARYQLEAAAACLAVFNGGYQFDP